MWFCVLTLRRPNVKLLACSVSCDVRNCAAFFEGVSASPVYPSDNSGIKMKMGMEQW